MRAISVSVKVEPRDLWVGLFWDRGFVAADAGGECYSSGDPGAFRLADVVEFGTPVYRCLTVWACLLPCLPVRVRVRFGRPVARGTA